MIVKGFELDFWGTVSGLSFEEVIERGFERQLNYDVRFEGRLQRAPGSCTLRDGR